VTVCVAVTVAFTSCDDAVAVQISAVPNCAFARRTRVHDSPAPLTVADCLTVVFGPSEDTNATSTASGAAVVNGAVTRVPMPSDTTIRSTANDGPDETVKSTVEP